MQRSPRLQSPPHHPHAGPQTPGPHCNHAQDVWNQSAISCRFNSCNILLHTQCSTVHTKLLELQCTIWSVKSINYTDHIVADVHSASDRDSDSDIDIDIDSEYGAQNIVSILL